MEAMWVPQMLQWLQDSLASVMQQGPGMVSKDIVQLVIEDHKRVRELWRQYNVAGNTTQQKRLLALDIIRHSCIHSKKEDMVLNPALLQHTSFANVGSEAMLSQHQQLEEQLVGLLASCVWEPGFDAALQDYMQAVEPHLRMEEQELLPELQRVLSHEQLMQLGREFEWAKLVAPSRPHSWSPKAPAGLTHAVNTLLTPLDFVLDLMAYRGAPTL